MLVGEMTTAATRVSDSADSAAMLDPDYALLPICSYDGIQYYIIIAYKGRTNFNSAGSSLRR